MVVDAFDELSQKGRQALTEGNGVQARQYYLKALAERPDSPDAHYGLATACFLLSDLETAAFHFKEVTRLDPLRPGAHINLGAVYNRLGQIDDAIKALRRGIQLDSRRAEAYYNLGVAYKRGGQLELAVQAYREATHLNPRMPDGHYNLANLLLEMGRFTQAIAHYKQALELNPRFEKARVGLTQAEEALQRENGQLAGQPTATPAPATKSAGLANPERQLDPTLDGPILSALHKATVVSEHHARDLCKLIEEEVEPSIKELSSTLLYPERSSVSLADRVAKFELALKTMKGLHVHLQSSIRRLQQLQDRLQMPPGEG